MTDLRSLDPESVTDADMDRQEKAYDFALAQLELIPDAVIAALDVTFPDWFAHIQRRIESDRLNALIAEDEEARMEAEAERAEDRDYERERSW